MEPTTQEHHSLPRYWYIVAVFFVVLFVYGLTLKQSPKLQNTSSTVPVSQKPPPVNPKTTGRNFGQFTLTRSTSNLYLMQINTGGESLTDADVIIEFDPSRVTIGKVTALNAQISVFQKEVVPGLVAVTLSTPFANKNGIVLNTETVLNIPVTRKNSAEDGIKIVGEYKQFTSKWFNAKGEELLPHLVVNK